MDNPCSEILLDSGECTLEVNTWELMKMRLRYITETLREENKSKSTTIICTRPDTDYIVRRLDGTSPGVELLTSHPYIQQYHK